MYIITKRFDFSAAHRLQHLPETHKCYNLHGHNYIVVLELRSNNLDENGFVRDYGDLHVVKEWLDKTFDHKYLNEVLKSSGEATTAENLAGLIWRQFAMQFPELYSVTVKETPNTSATYERD